MLLAVDVGNTQIHLGIFAEEELVDHWRLATAPDATADELAVALNGLLAVSGIELGRIDASIVSAVVPQLGHEFERLSERYLDKPCLLVGPALKTGMPIKIDNPHELGADRLVNAVAAHDRAGGPCVAVDFGTSTNFDVVSAAGEYLGGVIAPGVEISMEALTERTAKLPRIDLTAPESVIGRNTQETMQSGVVYGFAGLVDGVCRRLNDELDGEATFIATGGLANVIAPYCETIDDVDDLLTLTGLRLINDRNT